MYRALAWKAVRVGANLASCTDLARLAVQTAIRMLPGPSGSRVLVDGRDVTAEIRTPVMDEASSLVSACPDVRAHLVALQRAMAKEGGVVMDGRDIGTVVLPEADLKFYLDADLAVRAARRLRDLQGAGVPADMKSVHVEVGRRDARDRGRDVSPLAAAPDAIPINSTALDAEQVVCLMLAAVQKSLHPDNP